MHHGITSDGIHIILADFRAHVYCDMQLSKLGSSAKQTVPLASQAGLLTARHSFRAHAVCGTANVRCSLPCKCLSVLCTIVACPFLLCPALLCSALYLSTPPALLYSALPFSTLPCFTLPYPAPPCPALHMPACPTASQHIAAVLG